MSDYESQQPELPLQFSVMDKVRAYGYNHLMKHEQVQLTFELMGFYRPNPGFESVKELFDASPSKLKKHFTKTQIIKLKTIRELSAQYLKEEIMKSQTVLTNPEAVKDFLKLKIGNDSKERIICVFVDAKNQLIDCRIMSTGTVDQAVLYPREIIKEALELNATGIIMAHNHPSGHTDPSGNDIRLTEKVREAGEAMDIKILDHMIVGRDEYFSFLENDLLEERASYSISPRNTSEKNSISEKTLSSYSPKRENNVSKAFIDGIKHLKEQEKQLLNKRLEKIIGCRNLHVDDLPNTMYIINKTFNTFIKEYRTTGYVDFEKIGKKIGLGSSNLNRIFDKEVYGFFERNFLEESELKRFKRLVPDAKTRQSLFADYIRKKPLDLSVYTQKEANFIRRMLRKIIKGISQLMGKKHELEMLFEDFKQGRYENIERLKDEKTIINSSEINRYDSLKGIDMIIGDVDFGKTEIPDTGDVKEIAGTVKFTGSQINSLGKIHTVGALDLRESNIDNLGNLKTVHKDVYTNDFVRFGSWKQVDIGRDFIAYEANMTSKYKQLRQSPAKEPGIAKVHGSEKER